ncbi:S-layer homology domain-containing protein [Paenibacillus sp. 1001270B_150601_E10]|uniref:S-layer homology domain-containing protein n=1 Tax=Paenibacillus sp. 1001270B_150601_E10 TaxID=2787079 RepID=UPI001E2D27F9|nr:S-layer homology domain-containing protein [Paenibacillus sp. 1001270B_150601_E10]
MSVKRYIKGAIIGLTILAISMTSIPAMAASSSGTDRFAMAYIYFGTPSKYVQAVDSTKGSLDMVSPSYFDLNSDGSLKLTEAVDPNFVAEMHKRGIKVVPFLSNHWDRELGKKALSNRAALTKQVAQAIEKYNLDGVNVDIENVTEKERDAYTDLVRRLREAIPAHKEVSTAVAANPEGWTTGWHGSYNNAALAKVSDYLMIMSYDESYQGGAPGPVAGLPWVEKTIKQALKTVPSEKIVLGIPFYGRYWSADGRYKGLGIQNHLVEQLIQDYNGKVSYDSTQQSAKATFTIKASDKKPVIHGVTLSAGQYTVWYENEASIKAKLQLVNKYNLKGAGNWSLNEESGNTWDYYKTWLNGTLFYDTIGHWAKDQIEFVFHEKWMTGVANGQFAPNQSLTRAQAASVLMRIQDRNAPDQAEQVSFKDVPANHWAWNDIQAAQAAGYITGFADGSFRPNQAVTREQLAVMLARTLKLDTEHAIGSTAFKDVPTTRWSSASIKALAQQGVLDGYGDGTFRPTRAVTRAEMAAVLQSAESLLR